MLHQTIFPLVLPLTAIPSARLEAEDTLPPFFMPMRLPSPIMPAGAGFGFGPPVVTPGLVPAIGIGAGFGVIGVAGAPVIVGFTPGLGGAAGNIGPVYPGAYLVII
jgi:hypothetical protein